MSKIKEDKVKFILGALGIGIIFKSSLRPGTFINCKYTEFVNSKQKGSYVIVTVFNHKTGPLK